MKRNLIQAALASILGPVARPFAMALARNMVPWTTYNYKGGVVNGNASGPTYSPMPFSVAEVKLDFPAIVAARAAAGQAALAAADILQVVGVKAGTWVPMVALETVTVEGETATVDVGDGTDPNGFIATGDVNATGWVSSLITTAYSLATAGGKLYADDDTIDLTMNTATFNLAVLHLFVPMVDLRRAR